MAIEKKNLQELTDEELKDVNGGLQARPDVDVDFHIDFHGGYMGNTMYTTMLQAGQCAPGFKLDDAGNCVRDYEIAICN